MTHTQGDWEVMRGRYGASPVPVMVNPHRQIRMPEEIEIVAVAHGKTEVERQANAKLIAGSKEMLKALRMALADLEALDEPGCDGLTETTEAVRAAIAKAT